MSTLVNSAELLSEALQIVIVGHRGEPATTAMIAAVHTASLPNKVLQVIAPGADLPDHHPAHGKGQISGAATAYICQGAVCSAPFAEPGALSVDLNAR
jgi:hypothetical protein